MKDKGIGILRKVWIISIVLSLLSFTIMPAPNNVVSGSTIVSMELKAGWNFMGMPRSISASDLALKSNYINSIVYKSSDGYYVTYIPSLGITDFTCEIGEGVYIHSEADTTITFALSTSTGYFGEDLIVTGDLEVVGNSIFGKNLTVRGSMSVMGNLEVNSLNVTENLTVDGDLTINENLKVGNDLTVNGNVIVGKNPSPTGGREGEYEMISSIMVQTINGNLIVENDLTVYENLKVGENLTVNDNLMVGKDLTVNENLIVGKNLTVGNLTITDDTTYNGNLTVGKNLTVNENVMVGKNLNVNEYLTVGKDLTVNENLIVGKDLIVGNLTITEDLNYGGNLTVGENLTVNGNLIVSKDLIVGNLTITEDMNYGGNLNVINDLTVGGNIIVTGNMAVGGDSTIGGDLSVAGDIIGATGRTADFIVSASNAPPQWQNQGDYQCDGISDEEELQYALDKCSTTGGKIVLSTGDFYWASAPTYYSNIVVQGQGSGTNIILTADIVPFSFPNIQKSEIRDLDVTVTDGHTEAIIETISDGVGNSVTYCEFDNIYIRNPYGEPNHYYTGIRIKMDNGRPQYMNTYSNIFMYYCKKGIHIQALNGGTWVNGNLFKKIMVWGYETFIDFDKSPNATNIANRNTFIDVKCQTRPYSIDGIKNVQRNGNIFIDCLVWDWYVATNPHYAWSISSEAFDTIIMDTAYDPTSSYVLDNGHNTLWIAPGYGDGKSSSSGTVTVSHEDWVYHGLGTASIIVSLTPHENVDVWIMDKNDTQFQVGVSSGTVTVDWYAEV